MKPALTRFAVGIFLAILLPGPALAQEVPPGKFEAKGLLVPCEHARLASRAKGVIEIIKREGDTIRKGEAVMELESEMERLQLQQQRHILDLRTFEREASDELSSKSVISKTEVEEKRVNHEVAKVQLAQAERLLAMRQVIAPFDGVVTERLRERGEAVDEFTPVISLVNLGRLYLEVFLPASRIREVKLGEEVTIATEDLPQRSFTGRVAELAPAVNAASGDFKVRILVENPRGEIVSGTAAVAVFGGGS